MAVDGRKLRDTLRLGSEDWIEFPCSQCEKDGKNVASIKHCVECGENLCKTCFSYHEKYTRGHQVMEKLRDKFELKKPELPVQRCDKHCGKLVDVYCHDHDIVGCSTCIAIDHGSCKGKQFIPEVVKSSSIAKEMLKLDASIEQILTRLDKLKHDTRDRLKQLQKEKNEILKEIRDLRKKINDHLDQMEKTIVSDVESRFAIKMQSINQSVETVNNMTSSVSQRRKTLQEARNINDAEMFVRIKQGAENLREHESNIKQLSSEVEMKSVKLFPNRLTADLFDGKNNIFGVISEIIIPKSIEHFGDFSVQLLSDKETCIISDVCLTTGGSIVCVDGTNNKLKKLDRSYNVIEHLDMPSQPVCLCEVDNNLLAVTLWMEKKVQFVPREPLKLGRSLIVGDRCRAIDCHDGKLYVCCGGADKEGPGHIEVYDINGGLLRIFYEGVMLPFHIKAGNNGIIYVADNRIGSKKLFRANKHDFKVSEIRINTLTGVGRFCRIGESQLCIPGWESNNIVLISDDADQHHELLTVRDGIMKPWCVFFNEKKSQLVVVFDNSHVIKVYHVII